MKEKKEKNKNLLKKVLKGTAVGTGVGVGGSKLSDEIVSTLNKKTNTDLGKGREQTLKKLINKAKEKGFDVKKNNYSAYSPGLNKIKYNPKDGPAGFAHELGHAEITNKLPFSNKNVGKANKIAEDFSRKFSPIAAGAGVGTHMAIKDKNPELAKKVRNATLLSTGLSTLPPLANEAAASIKGIKSLKSLNSLKKNDIKQLGKAFGTHASNLAPLLASGAYFAYDKHKNNREGGDDD